MGEDGGMILRPSQNSRLWAEGSAGLKSDASRDWRPGSRSQILRLAFLLAALTLHPPTTITSRTLTQ
jgi:hypothetical protein